MTDQLTSKVICGDSAQVLKTLPNECVDLKVTSPPYDDLRNYKGYSFDFETIAKELFRVIKHGGVCVWVVGDSSLKYNESGTSFKQALYFKEIGFKLYDTMIYHKNSTGSPPHDGIYNQVFEYMFIFSKGKPKTFNAIRDKKNAYRGEKKVIGFRDNDVRTERKEITVAYYNKRDNIWSYNTGFNLSTKDKIAFEHPAIFPEKLAKDHIISWSNEGDLILDPFAGSGTTLKMAKLLNRSYLGIEISKEYCELIEKRLAKYDNQRLEAFIT